MIDISDIIKDHYGWQYGICVNGDVVTITYCGFPIANYGLRLFENGFPVINFRSGLDQYFRSKGCMWTLSDADIDVMNAAYKQGCVLSLHNKNWIKVHPYFDWRIGYNACIAVINNQSEMLLVDGKDELLEILDKFK